MKILKQNYQVISEKGSYSLEIWLLEVPSKEKVLVQKISNLKSEPCSSANSRIL